MTWFESLDALVIIGVVIAVSRKYGSVLNPVSLNGAFLFVSNIIGEIVFRDAGFLEVSRHVLVLAQILSALYFLAFGVAYLVKASPFDWVFAWLRRLSAPFGLNTGIEKSVTSIPTFVLEFGCVFLLLMVLSGAGMLWITSPRDAYQFHRAGVGVLWSLASASLYLAYFVFLLRYGKNAKRVFGGALFFAVCSYVLGSKGLMLGYFMFGMIYTQYHLRRIKFRMIILAGVATTLVFVGLQFAFGTAADTLHAVMYFDYMPNTEQFLDSSVFGFQHGKLTLSSLWMYVPRALYPAKPYAYGSSSITEMMYPGAAEASGSTPGLTGWIVPYTDFGVLGVLLSGIFDALLSKAAFELFLREKSLVSFALAAQIGFPFGMVVFYNAPFPVFWIWLVAQGAIIGFLELAGSASTILRAESYSPSRLTSGS